VTIYAAAKASAGYCARSPHPGRRWKQYARDGKQTGNPAALGEVLVKLAAMDNPPKQFMAGADAIEAVEPVLQGRLAEIEAYNTCLKRRRDHFDSNGAERACTLTIGPGSEIFSVMSFLELVASRYPFEA